MHTCRITIIVSGRGCMRLCFWTGFSWPLCTPALLSAPGMECLQENMHTHTYWTMLSRHQHRRPDNIMMLPSSGWNVYFKNVRVSSSKYGHTDPSSVTNYFILFHLFIIFNFLSFFPPMISRQNDIHSWFVWFLLSSKNSVRIFCFPPLQIISNFLAVVQGHN